MKTISVTIFLLIFLVLVFSRMMNLKVKMYFDSQKQLIDTEFQKKLQF